MKLNKKAKMILIAVAVIVIGAIYLYAIKNGQDTSELTHELVGAVLGEDAADVLVGNAATADSDPTPTPEADYVTYKFRNDKLLSQHYEKHGIEMGFDSKNSYEKAASDVINNPAALHKTEKEDGDYVYYVEETNEFVILSTDGYIRTYFLPNAGLAYYNRQ